jgi:hypothetical protein
VGRDEPVGGKALIHTSDQQLNTDDVALGNRKLLQVEVAGGPQQQWDPRPMCRRKADGIRAHVLLCFLGLVLVRVGDDFTQQTRSQTRCELQGLMLVGLRGPSG